MASGDRDLPFIPILSNNPPSSNSHSTRSFDRTGRSRRHPSSNDDREAKEISQLLLKFTEQIQLEKRRADEAERKTREITEHLRSVNHARLLALQDAQRANEELKLYKIQLRLAQREVNRAQDVLQVVDRQRHQAEKEAAKTRSRFRQLNEDMLVHQAREEGRRMGVQEGLARGRDLVFQENRTLNSFAEDDSPDIDDIDEDYDLDSLDQSRSSVSDIANDDVDFQSRPPSTFEHIRPTTPPPLPIPMPRQEPIPVPPSVVHSSPPLPVEIVPPVSVRGVTPSPRRPNVPIPPDNFIPHLDRDNILRMPPPFEFHRAPTPERPQTPSVMGHESDEPLIIPGPRTISSQNRHYPRPSSPESNSTTISQLEMVNEPYLSTLRTPMSVIPEVQSDQSTPTPQAMNGHRDLRHQRSSGSHASHQAHLTANVANGDRSKQATHSRRRSNGSVSAPLQTMSTYQRHKGSLSSGSLPSIDIQPPSRPLSHISQDRNSSRQLGRSNSPEFTMGPSSSNHEAEKPMPGNYSPYVKSQEFGGPPPVIPDPKLYGPDSDDDAVSSAQSYADTLTTPPPSNGRNESAWNAGLALSGQVPQFSSSVTSKGAPLGKADTTRKTRR